MLIELYRIEKLDAPEQGPYIYAEELLEDIAKRLGCRNPEALLPVEEDLPSYNSEYHHCAFPNLRSMKNLFDQVLLRYLFDQNFVVSCYTVPANAVLTCEIQSVFSLKDAVNRQVMDNEFIIGLKDVVMEEFCG